MTGVVYDDDFAVHECVWDENYSESPQRYTSILDRCVTYIIMSIRYFIYYKTNLMNGFCFVIFNRCNSLGLIDRCVKIDTRPATDEELLSKHTDEHIDLLKTTDGWQDNDQLEWISSKYDSIYLHPVS